MQDYKKAIKYLSQIEYIDDMINVKQQEIDSLRAKATSMQMNTDSERVQSSGCKDKIGDYCSKIVDLCEEINHDIDDFVDKKADMMHTIDKLENLEERRLLYYRYFQYLPFTKIAQEMNVSESTVYRTHKSAVQNIVNILKVDSS